jgi:hypothetical protein
MFLVEIEPGREELYHSVNALATAIQSGVVGPRSRIFHRSSSSWVSITVHPEFRKAAAARESAPLPPLARTRWTFFGHESNEREISDPQAADDKAKKGPEPDKRHPGLRSLLSRAWRGRLPVPSPSKTASS